MPLTRATRNTTSDRDSLPLRFGPAFLLQVSVTLRPNSLVHIYGLIHSNLPRCARPSPTSAPPPTPWLQYLPLAFSLSAGHHLCLSLPTHSFLASFSAQPKLLGFPHFESTRSNKMPPAYTSQQKAAIIEFVSVTQSDKTSAAKVLKQANWNVGAAVNS